MTTERLYHLILLDSKGQEFESQLTKGGTPRTLAAIERYLEGDMQFYVSKITIADAISTGKEGDEATSGAPSRATASRPSPSAGSEAKK